MAEKPCCQGISHTPFSQSKLLIPPRTREPAVSLSTLSNENLVDISNNFITQSQQVAILAQAQDQESLLGQIAQEIEQISDSREQSNLAASTAILAGLVLNKEIIQRLLRKDIMKESVIYPEIWSEGLQEGRQEGEANLALRLLNRRIGGISPELSPKIRGLSLEQLENLFPYPPVPGKPVQDAPMVL